MSEAMTEEAPKPAIEWAAGWGDQLKEGDLIRMPKGGGAVRVIKLRKLTHNHPRPLVVDDQDDGHWQWGVIVENPAGLQLHMYINPYDPIHIAVEIPTDLADIAGGEATGSDGAVG